MTTLNSVPRLSVAMALGGGFSGCCLILAGWETLVLRNYDPLLGNPEGVFVMLAVLSLVPSAGAVIGGLVGGCLAPRIAHRHAFRLHIISAVTGVAMFGVVLGLNALRVWLDEPRHPTGRIGVAVAVFGIPLLIACLTWWVIIKLAVYRGWLAVASRVGAHCENCGYDLRGRGSDGGVCPECGTPQALPRNVETSTSPNVQSIRSTIEP